MNVVSGAVKALIFIYTDSMVLETVVVAGSHMHVMIALFGLEMR